VPVPARHVFSTIEGWTDNIKAIQDERVKLAIVTANNHYAGFGPGTVNIFRNILGLPQANWKEMREEKQEPHDSKQRTLSEFLS
jgi:hypothetical protein